MLLYRYMKNTQFAMLIAIVGFFGMFASASAQILPASTLLATKGHLVAVTPNTTGTLTPAVNVNTTPIAANTAAINNTIPLSVVGQNTGTLTPSIDLTVVYPNANTLNLDGLNIAAQPVVPVQEPTPTPTPAPTPAPASNGGTGISGTGQYTGGGMYGAQVQPVTYSYTPAPVAAQTAPTVIYKTVYKDAPVKQQIPLLDETVDEAKIISSHDRVGTSQHAASAFGLGSISLVGVLAAIAVVLGIMVAVREYTAKKRYQEQAHMHVHA